MRALYIGKFQPFHKGHKKVVELLRSFSNQIMIGIGSPQCERYFSLEERVQMVFKNTDISPFIAEDLQENHPMYSDWGQYILNQTGSVNLIATGNDYVREDFIAHDIPVLWLPRYFGISGTEIRDKIMNKDEGWKDFVHVVSVPIIESSLFYKRYWGKYGAL